MCSNKLFHQGMVPVKSSVFKCVPQTCLTKTLVTRQREHFRHSASLDKCSETTFIVSVFEVQLDSHTQMGVESCYESHQCYIPGINDAKINVRDVLGLLDALCSSSCGMESYH